MTTTITMPVADDLHVHLRQEGMKRRVTPLVRAGGVMVSGARTAAAAY